MRVGIQGLAWKRPFGIGWSLIVIRSLYLWLSLSKACAREHAHHAFPSACQCLTLLFCILFAVAAGRGFEREKTYNVWIHFAPLEVQHGGRHRLSTHVVALALWN
eukprot:149323-Rhodomonas_salina.1